MVDEYLRQGPLDFAKIPLKVEGDQGTYNGTTVLVDYGFRGQIALRGSLSVSGFADAVEKIIGLRPSEQPNVAIGGENFPRLLWLGPEEWLIVTKDELTNETVLNLNERLQDHQNSEVNRF